VVVICFSTRAIVTSISIIVDLRNVKFKKWLSEDNILLSLCLGVFYILVDTVPTVYQIIGIRLVVQEKKRNDKEHKFTLVSDNDINQENRQINRSKNPDETGDSDSETSMLAKSNFM
jgi:hypothetical protein